VTIDNIGDEEQFGPVSCGDRERARRNKCPLGLPSHGRVFRRLFSRAPLPALAAAVLLALTLLVIVPVAAWASGVETGPQGIAVDGSGDVYVSDWARDTIDEITPQGVSILAGIPGQYGSPTPGPATDSTLDYPIGLAVSKAGDLYIVDFGNCVVEKVTPPGTLSIVAGEVGQCGTPTPGPATSSMLASPIGVAVDSSGNLYIADQGTENGPNDVIEKVTSSGTLSIFAGELGASGAPTPGPATDSMLNYPQAVAVDGAGDVFIADTSNGVVEKVNAEGILSIYARSYNPQGVAVSSSGDVYVTDTGTNTVETVDTAGQLSVIAGNGQMGEPTPGPATDSMLDLPDAAAVDSGGNLYISDQGNDLAEEVTPAGDLSIIWNAEDPIPGSTLAVSLAGSGSGTVASSPSGIACPKTCFGGYASDTQVTLTATPMPGSTFVGWSGAGCSGTGTCQVTMSSDMAVTATFQQLTSATLTVALAGSGSGSVSSSPLGFACPASCSYAYEPDMQVTLTATPVSGSRFVGWEGSGCSGIGTCQVTMGSEAAVTAMFERLPVLSVSITGSGAGSLESSPSGIACPGTCSYAYPPGTRVTLIPTAASGSRFVGWEGSGCSGIATCQVTLGSDVAVTAMFEKLPPATPLEHQLPIQPFSSPASFKPPAPALSHVKLGSKLLTARKGASLQFVVSQAAMIEVVIAQNVKGHKLSGVCKPAAKKGKSCTTTVEKRTLTSSGSEGSNTLELKLAGLGKGSYTATISAENANGKSSPVLVAFTLTWSG